MSKPIRVFIYEQDGDTFCYTLEFFKQFKLETEEAVEAVYEETGKWYTIQPKTITTGKWWELKNECLDPADGSGLTMNFEKLARACLRDCVASWDVPGVDGGVATIGSPDALHPLVADTIGQALAQRVRGGGIDPRFFDYLKNQPKQS